MYNDDTPIRKKRGKRRAKKNFFFSPIPNGKRRKSRNEIEFDEVQNLETAYSGLLIIVGLIFLMNPTMSQTFISVLTGILMIILALLNFFNKQTRLNPLYKFSKIEGLINIIIGIITLLSALITSLKITVLIGIWFILLSIFQGYITVQLKIIEEQGWLLHTVSTLLTIFMGIVIIINPFERLEISVLAGAFLILYGILNASTCQLRVKRSTKILDHL